METDIYDEVFETQNFSNISSPEMISVNVNNWADLRPLNLNLPDTLITTKNFSFSSLIKNDGNLAASGSWRDELYISVDSTFNISTAIKLSNFNFNGNVPIGNNYQVSGSVAMPLSDELGLAADSSWYYFYVSVNSNLGLFENGATGNNVFRSDSVFIYDRPVDHLVEYVHVDDTIPSYQNFNVEWRVRNIGYRSGGHYYNKWSDAVYLSLDTVYSANDIFLGSKYFTSPLNTNQSYTQNISLGVPGSLPSDSLYVIVLSDYRGEIDGEEVRINNENLRRDINGNPIITYFDFPPRADLIPFDFVAPPTAVAGQPITVKFKVRNSGVGTALPTSWVDKITLSLGYGGGGQRLYNKTHTGGLDTNQIYQDSVQIFIPNGASGNYVLTLNVDHNKSVHELLETNNLVHSLISITQLPKTDLVASSIAAAGSMTSGTIDSVQWNLKNISQKPAVGFTRQAVYLSVDTIWDINDPLFEIIDGNINIAAGDSVAYVAKGLVNAASEGANYFIIRVDLLNNINEENEVNNVSKSHPVFVQFQEIFIDIKQGGELDNDHLQYYKLAIDTSLANETIQIIAYGDSINASLDLYVSHSTSPTISVYDFADFDPFSNVKRIVIPSADTGNYYIAIDGLSSIQSSQNDTVLAQVIPFSISQIQSNRGGNTGNVTVRISGAKFEHNMIARLIQGVDTIVSHIPNSYLINSTAVWVTFALNGADTGLYDVQLVKQSGAIASLNSAFTIEPGNSGTFTVTGMGNTGMIGDPTMPGCDPGAGAGVNQNLQVTVNHPYQERTGRNVPVTILYANQSNVDIAVPTRLLISELFPVAWVPNFPDYSNRQLILEFKEPGSPPGILRAGASGGLTFYTRVIGPIMNNYYIK